MRVRTWGRFAAGLVLSLATGLAILPAPMAHADTAPPVANDPANPETVSAKPLPTVQIDGVAWSQTVVGNTVYVAGQFNTARPAGSAPGVNTVPRTNLLAYDLTTGNLISTWVANTNAVAKVVTASPDGKHIYVGGSFTTVTGSNGTAVTRRRIVSLDPSTGAVQAGFNPNPDATVASIVATNTAVYFGGSFSAAGGATRSRLAAWAPAATGNGTLLNWAPQAVGGTVAALTITPDGQKIIAGGQFTTMNGSSNPGYGLAALEPTTGALLPWAVNATIRDAGPNSGITSLTTDSDSVYATGFQYGSGGDFEGTTRDQPRRHHQLGRGLPRRHLQRVPDQRRCLQGRPHPLLRQHPRRLQPARGLALLPRSGVLQAGHRCRSHRVLRLPQLRRHEGPLDPAVVPAARRRHLHRSDAGRLVAGRQRQVRRRGR